MQEQPQSPGCIGSSLGFEGCSKVAEACHIGGADVFGQCFVLIHALVIQDIILETTDVEDIASMICTTQMFIEISSLSFQTRSVCLKKSKNMC